MENMDSHNCSNYLQANFFFFNNGLFGLINKFLVKSYMLRSEHFYSL